MRRGLRSRFVRFSWRREALEIASCSWRWSPKDLFPMVIVYKGRITWIWLFLSTGVMDVAELERWEEALSSWGILFLGRPLLLIYYELET